MIAQKEGVVGTKCGGGGNKGGEGAGGSQFERLERKPGTLSTLCWHISRRQQKKRGPLAFYFLHELFRGRTSLQLCGEYYVTYFVSQLFNISL